jgi:hypothetical protein
VRKTADTLGVVGAVLVVAVPIAMPVALPDAVEGALLGPLVGAVIGACLLAVSVMALVAIAFARRRPALSAALYFIGAVLGAVFLVLTGSMFVDSAWAFAFVVLVAPLAAAGILTLKSRRVPPSERAPGE